MPNLSTLNKATDAAQRASKEAYWRALWQTRGWRAYLMLPLSWLFRLIASVRRLLYQTGWLNQQTVRVPVVVVGGIVIGGVGKTPIVVRLVQSLQHAGFHPAIVSRGYTASNKKAKPCLEVTHQSHPEEVGDEPILLHLKTQIPVWVGRRRADTARALLSAYPECDVVICDDGLQHYQLARDFEVLVMDERGLGNGWCLPAGPLREASSRLNSVDAVIWHQRCQTESERLSLSEQEKHNDTTIHHYDFFSSIFDAYNLLNPKERLPLSLFVGKKILAWAGIAQPELFFKMLSGHGVNSVNWPLPDHFQFDDAFVAQEKQEQVDCILMTEKDAVKYLPLLKHRTDVSNRFWVVPLSVVENQGLFDLMSHLVDRLKTVKMSY